MLLCMRACGRVCAQAEPKPAARACRAVDHKRWLREVSTGKLSAAARGNRASNIYTNHAAIIAGHRAAASHRLQRLQRDGAGGLEAARKGAVLVRISAAGAANARAGRALFAG